MAAEPARELGAPPGRSRPDPGRPSPAPAAVVDLLPANERGFVSEGFRRLLPAAHTVEAHLRAAVADILGHPGGMVRAQLTFAVGRGLGIEPEAARDLAIAVEYFHTASLVFDDLPAMDDAATRRGRPCPHRMHGEGVAMLAGLALITRAYALLWGALGRLPASRRRRAAAVTAECLGIAGILDGQARDLHFAAPRETGAAGGAEVLGVAAGKTVPLVRLALVLPALAGGAGPPVVAALERLAIVWGLAYQALDDCRDTVMSREETGKTTARDVALGRPNLPAAVGWGAALAAVDRLLASARREVAALAPALADDGALGRLQGRLEDEARSVRLRLVELAGRCA